MVCIQTSIVGSEFVNQVLFSDTDPFPQMLCHYCCNALISMHTLILKALESHKFFQDKYGRHKKVSTSNLILKGSKDHTRYGDIKRTPTEFETVLLEKMKIESVIDDHFVYDDADEEDNVALKDLTKRIRQIKETIEMETKVKTKTRSAKSSKTGFKVNEPMKESLKHSLDISPAKSKHTVRDPNSKIVADVDNDEQSIIVGTEGSGKQEREECNLTQSDLEDDIKVEEETITANVEPTVKKKYKEKKKPRMCSICCKYINITLLLSNFCKTNFTFY